MREQHDGDAEAARSAEHLARRDGVGLFLYLDEIGAAVAQQRLERSGAVLRLLELTLAAHAARGEGEDLEAALAFPGDVDGPAEPRFAPALGDGHRHLETASCERAQLAPVGGLEVGVGEN